MPEKFDIRPGFKNMGFSLKSLKSFSLKSLIIKSIINFLFVFVAMNTLKYYQSIKKFCSSDKERGIIYHH